ncbi:hypothetical protein L6164_023904 [Bauhinia variegata]|uniref:Uncharacterized protein n=1 Tax=Bauhinia variegata TaxID=167791 RepID=A0ACB9ML80_BAUVA|nr:hypothetical protein L6164_023904 [Bauhinia variegata]
MRSSDNDWKSEELTSDGKQATKFYKSGLRRLFLIELNKALRRLTTTTTGQMNASNGFGLQILEEGSYSVLLKKVNQNKNFTALVDDSTLSLPHSFGKTWKFVPRALKDNFVVAVLLKSECLFLYQIIDFSLMKKRYEGLLGFYLSLLWYCLRELCNSGVMMKQEGFADRFTKFVLEHSCFSSEFRRTGI